MSTLGFMPSCSSSAVASSTHTCFWSRSVLVCTRPCCTSSLPQQSPSMRLLHCLALACYTDALAPTTSTTRRQLHLSLADAKSCTDAPTTSTRRRLLLSTATLAPTSALAADTPAESVRKAASNIPGLGPPDVLFPAAAFKGRWKVQRTVAARTGAVSLLASSPDAESYETRFLDYGDGEHVVIDRAFEAESRARAGAYGPGFEAAKARWEPSNPNVCTLESATGALLELKVTKRSFENPGPGGFGSSEYSRVAVAQGGVAAVPQILARRLQTRYRWDPNASIIEALEIQNVYDPQATGFADLNGAQPVAVIKSRLTLERR